MVEAVFRCCWSIGHNQEPGARRTYGIFAAVPPEYREGLAREAYPAGEPQAAR